MQTPTLNQITYISVSCVFLKTVVSKLCNYLCGNYYIKSHTPVNSTNKIFINSPRMYWRMISCACFSILHYTISNDVGTISALQLYNQKVTLLHWMNKQVSLWTKWFHGEIITAFLLDSLLYWIMTIAVGHCMNYGTSNR